MFVWVFELLFDIVLCVRPTIRSFVPSFVHFFVSFLVNPVALFFWLVGCFVPLFVSFSVDGSRTRVLLHCLQCRAQQISDVIVIPWRLM